MVRFFTILIIYAANLFFQAFSAVPQFENGKQYIYDYLLDQVVEQKILDDELTFNTALTWRCSIERIANPDENTEALRISFLAVRAIHEGPAYRGEVDSSQPEDERDKLIGHLRALAGQSIVLHYHKTTRELLIAKGGEKLAAAILKMLPRSQRNNNQRKAGIEARYSNEPLLQLWSMLLCMPSSSIENITLREPSLLELKRSWDQSSYSLKLANEEGPVKFEMHGFPANCTATLTEFAGSGAVNLDDAGSLSGLTGSYVFTLQWVALTHQVEQIHTVKYSFQREAVLDLSNAQEPVSNPKTE